MAELLCLINAIDEDVGLRAYGSVLFKALEEIEAFGDMFELWTRLDMKT